MKLSLIAARLAQVSGELQNAARHHDADMPDEFVPKFVMNIFADSKLIGALSDGGNRQPGCLATVAMMAITASLKTPQESKYCSVKLR